jgi:flagella basal body P-ring formation protein FlgA
MSPLPLALLLLQPAQAEDAGILALEEALRAHAGQRLEISAEDVEILHLGVAELPPCAATARAVLESPPSERFRGHALVQVELYGPTETCASLRLRPRVRIWTEAPVADASYQPGDAVRWELRRVSLERVTGDPIDPSRLDGRTWLARTTIDEGQPLTELLLRPSPDGPSGEQVRVLAGSGGLLIETPGRLMSDAFVGETVRVANLATRGVHDATFFAPGCVATSPVTPRMKEACPHVRNP